jgi:predicted nucleotidyltransferase
MRTDWETVDPRVVALLTKLGRSIALLPGVDRMVLYGSYAKGTNNEESDIDLAVFFSEKNDPLLLEEYRRLARICATPDFDIQVQAFSVAELESPCGIIEEIDLYGVELPLFLPQAQGGAASIAPAKSAGR